jgi:LPXTG-motif cell wall-anchored protein
VVGPAGTSGGAPTSAGPAGSVAPGGTIPNTGRDTTPEVLIAALLFLLGAIALALARRPRPDES